MESLNYEYLVLSSGFVYLYGGRKDLYFYMKNNLAVVLFRNI